MAVYAIKGTSTKESKKVEAIARFLREEFTQGGIRLGFDKFINQCAGWDEKNLSVFAGSMPTYAEVQTACYLVAKENESGEFIPVFESEDKKAGVVKSVKNSADVFARYYDKNKKRANNFDPTKLILGLLGAEKYSYSPEQIQSIQKALDLLK